MPSKVAEAYILLRASTDQLVADIAAARGKVTAMVPSLAGVWQTAWAGLSKIGDVLGQPFQQGLSFIIGSVQTAASVIRTALGAGFEAGARLARGAITGVYNIMQAVMTLGRGFANILSPLGPVFTKLGSFLAGVGQKAQSALTGLVGFASAAASKLAGWVTTAVGAVDTFLGGFLSGALSILGSLGNAVLGIAHGILGAVSALTLGALDILKTIVPPAAALFGKALGVALDMAASIIKPTMNALSQNLFDFDPAIQMAMQAEVRTAKLNAVLLGTGEAAGWSAAQLKAMASDVSALGGFGGADIEKAQIALLRFGQIRGEVFQQTLLASRQVAGMMEQDMASAANTLGKALENPARGMRALRIAGIILTPATEQMVKMRMAAGDLAGAQMAILDATKKYGDVAGAMANTVTGQLQAIKMQWAGVSRAIGDALLPLVDLVARFTKPLVQGISESLKAFFGGVALDSQNLVASAHKWIDDNKDQIVSWGRMIGDTVASVVQFVRNLFQWMGQGVVNVFHWMTGSANTDTVNIQDAVTSGLAVIETAVQNIPLVWKIAWTGIKLGWATLIDYLKQKWEEFKVWAVGHFKSWSAELAVALTPVKSPITDWITAWGEGARLDMERDLRKVGEDWKPDEKIGRLRDELNKATDEFSAKAAANIAKSRETPKVPGRGPRPDMTPTPLPLETTMKFTFSGFADMWKKTQESLTGGSMVQLAKATADNTGRAATAAEQTRDAVVALGGQLKNVNPGLA
jgi:hypothetical protein